MQSQAPLAPCVTALSVASGGRSRRIPDELTGELRATVKRLPRSGRMRLLPENPVYEPIENDEITITGKVMGIWRTPI